MLRSFDQVVPGDNLDEVPASINFETCSKPREWKRLVFSLTFFHAFVQERRKFGPLGWNIRYEFNDSDLETSIQSLRLFLDSPMAEVPWAALKYVTGAINYGGRVTDDWDRRTLMAIMEKFYSVDVITTDLEGFLLAQDGKGSNTYVIPFEGEEDVVVGTAAAAETTTEEGEDEDFDFDADGEKDENEQATTAAAATTVRRPRRPTRADYRNIITQWPLEAPPQVFGMHRNAEITFQLKESNDLVRTIITMGGGGGGGEGGGGNADQEVMETALKLVDVVPLDLDRDLAAKGIFDIDPITELMNSLDTVLSQEYLKFNKLLKALRATLKKLKDAIQGLAVMSVELESMYVSFLQGSVPDLWSNVAYPSLKPLASWVEDLKNRVLFIRNWLEIGQPKIFDLPAFYFPQGFMTAALQLHARKYKVAINTLKFSFEILSSKDQKKCEQWVRPGSVGALEDTTDVAVVEEEKKEKEEVDGDGDGGDEDVAAPVELMEDISKFDDGVLCSGMYLEGARVATSDDNGILQLEDQLPRQLVSELPVIHFLPEPNHVIHDSCYVCPVYKVSTRQGVLSTTGMSTNFVVSIELPRGTHTSSYWILRGTAALLNLDT